MSIEKQAGLLEAKKQLLKQKERMIKEKERRLRTKNFEEIGRIAFDAKISGLDRETLFGAFLEIAKKSANEKHLKEWKSHADSFYKVREREAKTPLSISFEKSPAVEIKNELKTRKFKWNSFRGEYYGYGNREELTSLLKATGISFQIDELK
jgi:hypothetical protein